VKNNGIGTRGFMPGTVFARSVDVGAMVRVFNGADAVSAFLQFGYQLFDKGGFAGLRASDDRYNRWHKSNLLYSDFTAILYHKKHEVTQRLEQSLIISAFVPLVNFVVNIKISINLKYQPSPAMRAVCHKAASAPQGETKVRKKECQAKI
jgi:hypothetical protein